MKTRRPSRAARVLDYMVSQAAFGSGVETRDHLVRVRAADLDQSNFVTSFDNIYDVLVSMPETAPVAEAYNTELDETVAALQAEEKSSRLFIFENAEPQGETSSSSSSTTRSTPRSACSS